jgi:(R,R)-butanediol dehydrogenase/meso-butanediol dehydrogenase/diacetyl reductase
MQVGLVTGKQQVTLVEMPNPEPVPGKAVVDVALCGICGTDIHAFQSGDPYNPAICGHEWTGNVSAVGADVALKEGDRVAIGMATACGHCATCVRGDPSHCEMAFMGMIGAGPLAATHGGFAPAIAIDASRLYPVDVDISDEAAAILEPVTIAVHAVRRTGIRLGDSVVVLGAGPIGLLVLQCARAAGAGVCILVEPQKTRRELGATLGADHTLNPAETDDIAGAINKIVGNAGADIVFECAGISRTVEQAPAYVRRGGTVALVGVPTAPSQFMAAEWLFKELRISTALGYLRNDFEVSKGLVADGRVQCEPLHTSTVSLEGLAGAFAELADAPEQVKVLVDPRL